EAGVEVAADELGEVRVAEDGAVGVAAAPEGEAQGEVLGALVVALLQAAVPVGQGEVALGAGGLPGAEVGLVVDGVGQVARGLHGRADGQEEPLGLQDRGHGIAHPQTLPSSRRRIPSSSRASGEAWMVRVAGGLYAGW